MDIKNPEILSPGGDFNSAIHAFKSGADAVYIGLKSFSARKKATNFKLEEIRALKTYANDNGKKIYVAINTLLKDEELEQLYPTLFKLEDINIDAVIVQDLGLADIVKRYTTLELHASTQLAVHNSHGIKQLKKMGFSRVVLSRELSLFEIETLKNEYKEMEFEIFIHGAQCYGFSGICLASSKIIGRSANRGECGQICRTWFNNNGKKEYSFSLNDLSLKEKVLKLKEIGVESLKIEGRLKGPGYASATASLYSDILNNRDSENSLKKSELEFNRGGMDLYLENAKDSQRVNKNYPGHIGRELGRVLSVGKSEITIESREEISNRDGLLILTKSLPAKPLKFSANILEKKGKRYRLKYNLSSDIDSLVYKISSHDKHLKDEKASSYKPWKKGINLEIELRTSSIYIETENFSSQYSFEFENANSPQDLNKIFSKTFFAGGDTKYNFFTQITNNSGLEHPFIPSSKLKAIRNLFQKEFIETKIDKIIEINDESNLREEEYISNSCQLPFITNFKKIICKNLTKKESSYLLPLAPVIFNTPMYLKELKQFLNNNTDKNFIVGLNNIAHLAFVDELPQQTKYYCDYGIFVLNNSTKNILKRSLPNLLGVTKWIEESKSKFYPPVFISRTCFKAQEDGCPKGCKKNFEYNISQQKNFKVIVEDCLTYTFTVSESVE
jgi:putative protease